MLKNNTTLVLLLFITAFAALSLENGWTVGLLASTPIAFIYGTLLLFSPSDTTRYWGLSLAIPSVLIFLFFGAYKILIVGVILTSIFLVVGFVKQRSNK